MSRAHRGIAAAALAILVASGLTVAAAPAAPAHANTANNAAGVGYYDRGDSSFHLSYSIPTGTQSDRAFVFGPPNQGGIVPVSGDWDGDGSSTVGWYRYSDASWHLTNELNGEGASNITFTYGPAGDTSIQPVVGDWDGDGKDTVGWYRPSDASWHLASSNSTSLTSTTFVWGIAGDATLQAVAGDWNGDGKATAGWYRPSDASWHLAASNSASPATTAFVWGPAGNTTVKAIVGDWDGNKTASVGWYRPSDASFHVTNTNAASGTSITANFGPAGDSSIVPLAGDWDGLIAPSTTAQSVAQRIVAQYNAGKVSFLYPGVYTREIVPLAQTGAAPAGCRVDIRILQVLAMTVDHFGSASVSDIGRPCIDSPTNCSSGSLHCQDPAKAIDVYKLGGVTIDGGNAQSIAYLRFIDSIAPSGSQAGQLQCRAATNFTNITRQFNDTCNHQHFDLGAAAGVVKYTG
jgi:hypothetical protein